MRQTLLDLIGLNPLKSMITYGGGDSGGGGGGGGGDDDKPAKKTIGQVSKTGQYAGDGFEFVENEGGYLTRTYTGAGKDNGLGTDVFAGGTSDNDTKAKVAQISLNEGSEFAGTAASATDGNLLNLVTQGDTGASDSYAAQVGVEDYTPTITYGGGDDSAAAAPVEKTFGEEFAEARAAGQDTFTYEGDLYTTELADVGVPGIDTSYAPVNYYDAFGNEYTSQAAATEADNLAAQQAAAAQAAIDAAAAAQAEKEAAAAAAALAAQQADEASLFEQPVVSDDAQDYLDTLGTDFDFGQFDVDAKDPRGDQIVSPTGTGIGQPTFSYVPQANTYTESLQEIADQSAAGTIGADEASALLGLGAGQPLTDTEVAAIMAPEIPVGQVDTSAKDADLSFGVTPSGPDIVKPGLTEDAVTFTGLDTGADFVPSGVVPEQKTGLVGEEYDPRTILPTSEQVAIATGTAQDAVDLTPYGAVYENIVGSGEVDTPGERLGQFINDLGVSAAQGGLEGPVAGAIEGAALYADEIAENLKRAVTPAGEYDPYTMYGYTVDPILDLAGYGEGQIDPSLAQAAAAARDTANAQAAAANQVTAASDFVAPAVTAIRDYAEQVGEQMSPDMRERVEKYATADPNTTFKDIFTGNVKSVSGESITTDIPALIVRGGEDLYDVVADVLLGGAAKKGLGLVFASSASEGAASSNTEAQNRITQAIADGTVDVQALADKKYGGDTALAEQAMRDAATEVSLVTAGPIAGAGDAALALGLGATGIPGLVGKAPGVVQAPVKLAGAGISGGLTEGGEQVGTNLAFNVGTGLNTDLAMGVPAQIVQGTIGQGVSATPSGIASTYNTGTAVDPNTFVPTSATAGQIAQPPAGITSAYTQAADSMAEAGVAGVGDVSTATSMDAMAAQEIINDQVATTGAVDPKVLQNLQDSTGLSMAELGTMVENAGSRVVGTETIPVNIPGGVSEDLIDQPTGIGGGSNIKVTPLPSGETMLTNNDTGRTTIVDQGADLQAAIQTFDEVTTPIDEQTAALTAEAATDINKPNTFISTRGDTEVDTTDDTTDDADIAEVVEVDDTVTGPEIKEDTGFDTEEQLELLLDDDQTQQLNLLDTTDTATEVEVTDDTTDDTKTDVEVADDTTVKDDTTDDTKTDVEVADDTTTDVDTTTDTNVTTLITTDQPPEDDDEDDVVVELEEEDVDDGGDDGIDVLVPPIVTTDEDGNTVTECPDGYTLVQTASGPMCQKSVTSTRQRAGASTRAYTGLSGNVGRRGPGQRRKTTTTTQRVRPTIRSA